MTTPRQSGSHEDELDVTPLRAAVPRQRSDRRRSVTEDADEWEAFRAATRRSRVIAVISAAIVLVGLVVELFVLETVSLPLAGVIILALLAHVFSLTGVARGSERSMFRVAAFARRNGLGFQLRKDGAGGYRALPFTSGIGHQRLAVVSAKRRGRTVEFGNLMSQAATGFFDRPCGYIAIPLSDRMPHLLADAGRLARVFGVRMPSQWHPSQRVDVPGARSFRLYAVDGAQGVARAFFTPEMVAVFERVAKRFDVEITGRHLYLLSKRDVSSGSARRWREQVGMVDDLLDAMNVSPVWDLLRGQARGRGPAHGEVRWAVAGPIVAVSAFAVVLFGVLLWVVFGLDIRF